MTAALALGLGAWPMSSRGDGLTSNSNTSNTATESLEFTLKTNQAIAANAGSPPAPGSTATTPPQVALEVSPVSVVQPPNPSVAALQILSDSTGYYNNNASQLSVETINSPSDGSPVTTQLLGLGLYGQGLPAGGSLTFSLPFAQSVVGNPATNFMPFTALDPSSAATDLHPQRDDRRPDDPQLHAPVRRPGALGHRDDRPDARTALAAGLVGPGRPRAVAGPQPWTLWPEGFARRWQVR